MSFKTVFHNYNWIKIAFGHHKNGIYIIIIIENKRRCLKTILNDFLFSFFKINNISNPIYKIVIENVKNIF